MEVLFKPEVYVAEVGICLASIFMDFRSFTNDCIFVAYLSIPDPTLIAGGDEFSDWRRGGAGLLCEREAHPRGAVEKRQWVSKHLQDADASYRGGAASRLQ